MNHFKKCYGRFLSDKRGATAIEYGLIVGLLSVALIAVLFTTGDNLKGVFTTLVTSLQAM